MSAGGNAAARLRSAADRSRALHQNYLQDPQRLREYDAFANWQNAYMGTSYDDLRSRPGYSDALDFVITDLTGVGVGQRDQDLARVVPVMARMLPDRALQTLAAAMELNVRVLETNLSVCETLFAGPSRPVVISERTFCAAYRQATTLANCLELATLTLHLGESLARIIRVRTLGLLLKAMHRPAHAAGFGALHDFLQTGYVRFQAIEDVPTFLDELHTRMKRILGHVFEAPLDTLSADPFPNRLAS